MNSGVGVKSKLKREGTCSRYKEDTQSSIIDENFGILYKILEFICQLFKMNKNEKFFYGENDKDYRFLTIGGQDLTMRLAGCLFKFEWILLTTTFIHSLGKKVIVELNICKCSSLINNIL